METTNFAERGVSSDAQNGKAWRVRRRDASAAIDRVRQPVRVQRRGDHEIACASRAQRGDLTVGPQFRDDSWFLRVTATLVLMLNRRPTRWRR